MKMNKPDEMHDPEELPAVKTLVKELPEDEPSLAWRAELNAKLESLKPARAAKPRWAAWPVWSSAVGMAALAGVAILMTRGGDAPTAKPQLAVTSDMLVDAHVESVARRELGLATGSDLRSDRGIPKITYEWDAVDLDLL